MSEFKKIFLSVTLLGILVSGGVVFRIYKSVHEDSPLAKRIEEALNSSEALTLSASEVISPASTSIPSSQPLQTFSKNSFGTPSEMPQNVQNDDQSLLEDTPIYVSYDSLWEDIYPSRPFLGEWSFDYPLTFNTCRLEFGATFGDFIGLRSGYGEAGAFITGSLFDNKGFFVDAREFFLGRQGYAASLGIGVRGPLNTFCNCHYAVWGVNLYYDHREAKLNEECQISNTVLCSHSEDRSFSRLGIGFECFTDYFDSRLNVYIPVDHTSYESNPAVFTYPSTGDVASYKHKLFLRYGFDGEVGKELLLSPSLSAYSGIGGYFYDHQDLKSFGGVQARLELTWKDFVRLEFLYSYDDRYHSGFRGKFLFSIPLEQLCHFFSDCCDACCSCIYDQPVRRNYVPFVEERQCWNWSW